MENKKASTPESQEEGRNKQKPGSALIKFVSAGFCLLSLLYLSGILHYFGFYLWAIQYNAIFVGMALSLTFLLTPARKGVARSRLPWYDIVLILCSLAGSAYIAINAPALTYYGKLIASPLEMVVGVAVLLALIEAVRRSFGWIMVTVILVFLAYAKFGYLIPGPLHVYYSNWPILIADVYLSSQGIFGSLASIAGGIILAFVAFGTFFVAAGGGEVFLKVALALTGAMTGGPAKAAIISSAMFGMVTGSPSSNVVATGVVTIPMMKKVGFKPHYAAAVESCTDAASLITPPVMGGVAFVMAERLGISYAELCIVAALPALLYYISVFAQVHLQAVKMRISGVSRDLLPSLTAALKEGWELAIPFLALVWLMFVLRLPETTSAIYSILAAIAISMFRRKNRINLKKFIDSLADTIQSLLSIINVIALAGIITAVLTVTGLGPRIGAGLITLFGGSTFLLVLATAITCYIMGMGVSMIASYVIVSALVVPALGTLGVAPLVSNFFIMYMVSSTVFTPPYCTAAYVAASIANANPFRVGLQSMRLGIVAFLIPIVIVFEPALLLIGTPSQIVLAIVTALLGIFTIAAGIEGYLLTYTNWLQRILLLLGGLLMFIPGLVTDIPGAGLLALVIIWQWIGSRRAAAPVT